ncbi:MAG TPA: FHA domain-containing protein [Anaerolineae bacterium]|nr:FHA domain-containing protein [Anaerolineae bacterium]
MQAIPLFKLTMRQGPRPDQAFELYKDVYTLGREAGNDIIINDPQVSRNHARLTLQGNAYLLEDLGSTNGTFVNGRRVSSPVALSAGDMVGLGDTVVLAVSGAADAAVTQVGRAPTAPALQAVPHPAAPRSAAPPPPPPAPVRVPVSTTPTAAETDAISSSRRMIVIGCAGLALLGVICLMGLVAWSFLDCPSFAQFWRSLPILSSIPIGC